MTKKIHKLSLSLVIPTFNDEKTIFHQLIACEKIVKKYCYSYEIIIAEDCGTDRTWDILQKKFKNNKNFRLIQNKKNLGITQNVRQLYLLAKKEFVFFYSADGDWNPDDIAGMIKKQQQTHAAIVIGKRRKKNGYTIYRHIISFLHRLLPLLMFGVDTYDPGGIKLIQRSLVHTKLVSKSQFFEAEIIIRGKKQGFQVVWYPVSYDKPYTGAGFGGGFFSACQSFLDMLKLRFASH